MGSKHVPQEWCEHGHMFGHCGYCERDEEIERLRVQLGEVRMCVNCGKTIPASEPRGTTLPECAGPDGLAACTFDMTPREAADYWRSEAHRLRAENAELRKDAERYRWLKGPETGFDDWLRVYKASATEIDEAIDKARGVQDDG